MDTPTTTEVRTSDADAAPISEATVIAHAVENALSAERSAATPSTVDKVAAATGIYTSWRNANLRRLPPQAFAQVEAASAALIVAIAAQL